MAFGPGPAWAVEQITPGDVNQDSITNWQDFFELLHAFDPSGHSLEPEADCNEDQRVDHRDVNLAILGRLLGRHGIPLPLPEETGVVTGVVLEDTGDAAVVIPIEGARVWVGTSHGFRLLAETGPDGAFRFEGVPAGPARLTAEHPDYHKRHEPVEVTAGQETQVTLLLPRRNHDLTDLSGFVWSAAHNDLAVMTPIEGAAVRVLPISGGEVVGDFNPEHNPGHEDPHQVAFTDDHGHYVIHDLPPGEYRVLVHARGYAPEERGIHIPEGEDEHFEDFVLAPAPNPFGQAAGTVFHYDPRLMLPSNPPLPGAHVVLEPVWEDLPVPNLQKIDGDDPGHPYPFPVYHAVTDASGHYLIDGVLPGKYHARAWARDHRPATAELQVATGQTTLQDFTLEWILTEKGAVAGTVSGVTPGHVEPIPLEDAVVHLLPKGPSPEDLTFPVYDLVSAARVRSTTTDSEGKYLFEAVPEGMYLVVAWARGWGQATGAAEVIGGETEVVDLLIVHHPPPPPASLSGHVFSASGTDPSAPAPLPGAHVLAFPVRPEMPGPMPLKHENGDPPDPRPFETVTDDNGYYEFPMLPPGPCKVIVLAEGHQPGEGFVVLPSGGAEILDFVLEPLPSGPGMVMGAVFTTGEDGSTWPIAGAQVRLAGANLPATLFPPPDKFEDPGHPPVLVFETVTNEDGYFEFAPVPPGFYLLQVRAEGFRPEHLPVALEPGGQVTVNVELFANQDPGEGGVLTGHVYQDNPAGLNVLEPIAEALLIAVPLGDFEIPIGQIPMPDLKNEGPGGGGMLPDSPFVTQTNPDGEYRFESLPSGKVAIVVIAEGFLPAFELAEILAGDTTIVDFFLRPMGGGGGHGSSLSGVVTGHSDNPTFQPIFIEGAEVKLHPVDPAGNQPVFPDPNHDWLVTHTGADGRYEFPDLNPGLYQMRVVADGYQPAELMVGVPPETHATQDVELQPVGQGTARLFGHVAEPMHANDPMKPVPGELMPVPGATVRLIPDDLVIIQTFPPPDVGIVRMTDESGFYNFEGIPAGGYGAVVYKEGYGPVMEHVQLDPNANQQKDWVILPLSNAPGSISGVVTEDVGLLDLWKPIAGAVVTLSGQFTDKTSRTATTGEDGSYSFGDVPPGAYHLDVHAEGYVPEEDNAMLAPGDNLMLNFQLLPSGQPEGGAVEGLVKIQLPAGGNFPAPGLPVRVKQLDNIPPGGQAFEAQTVTDERGHYRIGPIPPGHTKVIVQLPIGEPLRETVMVMEGQTTFKDFIIQANIPLPTQ
jgi:protocatechuate 3,4-dioxygenase beta subunit